MTELHPDLVDTPPFETQDLRARLAEFLSRPFHVQPDGVGRPVGGFICGVYAFFDYDGEPIYVGQTKERLATRIRRHLTNQRTDAVAMSVLDPFEVLDVEVWPLPQLERPGVSLAELKSSLDSLEFSVFEHAIAASRFKAILNEKDPPNAALVALPNSCRGRIVSPAIYKLRAHPDVRMARRAQVLARLAQVISERKVQPGLRRVFLTQTQRLEWLASRRHVALQTLVSMEDDELDAVAGEIQATLPGL
ncbi:MAG: GIY-YIG nuclease family protein [Pseudomonadota bacterium]